mmetsp:Transcript_71166/g.208586  ORF Transcript_71166/g.208586 Transcript_71166/m.208586 type:complete len:314 (-) Transcript_71166:133-1074(-)
MLAKLWALSLASGAHALRQPLKPDGGGTWVPQDGDAYLSTAQAFMDKHSKVCVGSWNGRFSCPADRLTRRFQSFNMPYRVDADAFLKKYKDRTIAFVGDSMVRQAFEAFVCSLGGYETDNVSLPLSNDNRWAVFQHNVTVLCSYRKSDPVENPDTLAKTLDSLAGADLVVFHVGSWLASREYMETVLHRWADLLSRLRSRLIILEYTAPHFDGRDFRAFQTGGGEPVACSKADGSFTSSPWSFRVSTANEFWKQRGVTVVPLFKLSEPVWEQHSGKYGGSFERNDCRHWCNPGPFTDARNLLVYKHLMEAELP